MVEQLSSALRQVPDACVNATIATSVSAELKALARSCLGRPCEGHSSLARATKSAWESIERLCSGSSVDDGAPAAAQLDVAVMLARLFRNVLAGVQVNKALVMLVEGQIRRTCYSVTAFDKLDDSRYLNLQKALYQLLSNLIADAGEAGEANPAAGLWEMYMSGERDAEVIHRALESHDAGWNLACLMLVLQAIRASPAGVQPLLSDPGTRLVQRIADKMPAWHAADEGTDEERCFGIAIEIFGEVFASRAQSDLYDSLARPGAPVTSAQVMLLKVLDGHLASSSLFDASGPSALAETTQYSFLVPAFLRAGLHIQAQAPKLSTTANSATLEEMDLPRAFEGVALASQCLVQLCLAGDQQEDVSNGGQLGQMTSGIKSSARQERVDRLGLPEVAVGLLYTLDKLIPRVKPYRLPAPADRSPGPTQAEEEGIKELEPLARLKRELVQLIGVFAHDDTEVQDRVREAGGVEIILSMCVVDERNPYIREHALLAVRNLMMGNPANQAVIKEMNPIGIVGEDGVLQEMPERLGLRRGRADTDAL